ncbi:MAG: hypothetical protein ABI645_06745 [Pseudomonadota bacterium]
MSIQENLRALAANDVPAAPFGFEAFERRRAMTAVRRRAAVVSATGSIAALAFVSITALLTQGPPRLQVDVAPVLDGAPADEQLPALVNLDQFDVTTDLEERIAVLDAEMSAARVGAAPAEQLRQLESTRAQLNQSLQRVSYAHSLLNL